MIVIKIVALLLSIAVLGLIIYVQSELADLKYRINLLHEIVDILCKLESIRGDEID